jgi:hypothetical protein
MTGFGMRPRPHNIWRVVVKRHGLNLIKRVRLEARDQLPQILGSVGCVVSENEFKAGERGRRYKTWNYLGNYNFKNKRNS